jgi:cyclic pyranopterin phosphate synthase
MPEDQYVWLPRDSILAFEETSRLVRVFASAGVSRIRITGGEPLLRHDLAELVRLLSSDSRLTDLALTTNGILLARYAEDLKAAGLGRVTVSLDTLRPDRFEDFTRSGRHADVLAGIQAVREAGFMGTKLNAVIVKGVNDDEVIDLLEFSRANGVEVRLIEYMDVGGATQWSLDQVVSRGELLRRIAERYGEVRWVEPNDGNPGPAPAERFILQDGTTFGIVASTTQPFCRACDRSRLTADGMWFLCLYAQSGVDLKGQLRSGASDDEIARLIAAVWEERSYRGAEERLVTPDRGVLYQVDGLRADPHREMHTRGG